MNDVSVVFTGIRTIKAQIADYLAEPFKDHFRFCKSKRPIDQLSGEEGHIIQIMFFVWSVYL